MPYESLVLGLALLLLHLLSVEGKLLALKDVSINTSSLARPGGDASKQPTSLELIPNGAIEHVHLTAVLLLLENGPRLLFLLYRLLAKLLTVVLGIPLPKRGGVDLHDGRLHQGLGTDQLVVGGVVHNIQNTSTAGDSLRAPREVSVLKAESPELGVATPDADLAYTLGPEPGVGGSPSQLKLSLLPVHRALASGGTALLER